MLYVLQDTTSYNTHYCGFGYSRYTFPGALLRTHTRASNHIVSFAVYVNQISVVYQTFQPDERGVLLNTHDSCLLSRENRYSAQSVRSIQTIHARAEAARSTNSAAEENRFDKSRTAVRRMSTIRLTKHAASLPEAACHTKYKTESR